jgi:hypothetical protein
MRVGGQLHAQAALPPGKETLYPLSRRLVGPQGWSGQVLKISPPTGFDPRTVQPVASRYTDCDIPAHIVYSYTEHTQKNGAVSLYSPLKPHHSFVYTLYIFLYIHLSDDSSV